MFRHLDSVTAYVDGTFCNGQYGGGYCIFHEDKLIYQDCGIGLNAGANKLRNIAGEMSACMHAALWIDKNVGRGIIVHDYTGLAKWVTGEWDTNNEFTKMYVDFMRPFYTLDIIKFQWVKGHTKVLGNEIADRLAKESVVLKQQWKF